ncbi:MAG: serine hydrolase [Candidatus Rokuibacteriota bacterium]|nr:MAG: serine hydrolase [Candidatus Rokubacteria bacterium]
MAGAVVVGDRLAWSYGYGLADVSRRIPMTDTTLMNVGSVSKTVTATAIMQLWEAGRLDLDTDVNEYLPFVLANPRFPDSPISIRQLLTHRSSIKDGPAYGASYFCGDPTISLSEWIEGYLAAGSAYYDASENFHTWEPGTLNPPEPPRPYSNVAFGLLGYLVERLADTPFQDYWRHRIFAPLGMDETGWFLGEVEGSNHAIPYSVVPDDFRQADGQELNGLLPASAETLELLAPGARFPHCLYSFPNYPDGLMRTSVRQLANFLMAYINDGTLGGTRLLQLQTVRMVLSSRHFGQALCWQAFELGNDILWGHSGADPGIATLMAFRPGDGVGVIVFANFDGGRTILNSVFERLFQESDSMR